MLLLQQLGGAALAFLYKIWRILQSDRKIDDLDSAEKEFRDALKEEIKFLKEDKRLCEAEKERLYNLLHELQTKIATFEASLTLCQQAHPAICPLLRDRNIN